VFGTGTKEEFGAVTEGRVEPSFAPIIDDSYRVIGHVGWIDGFEICVPKDTIRGGSKFAYILEKLRLGERRQQLLAEADKSDRGPYPNSRFHAATMSPPPGPKPAPCVPSAPTIKLKPTMWDDARRGPLRDASAEVRHRENLNYFLKAGGKALIGRKSAGDLLQREYEPYLLYQQMPLGEELYDLWHDRKWLVSSEYRFLVLVSPEGHLQSVLQVEKVEQEGLTTLDIAFEVIDTTLTVLMIIDIVTIPVVLFRAGVVVARAAAIRALEVAIDREAKAALDLTMREMRELTEAEFKAARGRGLSGKPPLLSAEELNKPVPQVKQGMGEKRRLNPRERAGVMKIIDVLDRIRSTTLDINADVESMLEAFRRGAVARSAEIARGPNTGTPVWEVIKSHVVKRLEFGKLAEQGWIEAYALEGSEGAGNVMRVLFRPKGDGFEVMLRQMHGGGFGL
jgi:hypothetical protein